MKHLTTILITVLAGIGLSHAAELATDRADNLAYTNGWTAGDEGGSGWGGAWTFSTVGSAGSFVGTSTNNGFGGGGIDSTGVALGLFGNNGGRINALRPFNGALSVGQSFRVQLDNGLIGAGEVGVRLLDAMNASAVQWEFGFASGQTNYQFRDAGSLFSTADSGIPFTDDGLELLFTLEGPTNYTLEVTSLGNGKITTHTGTLADADPIVGVSLFNDDAGLGPDYDAFFNRLAVTYDLPPLVRAADDASDAAYNAGWTNGANGGTGLGPWIFLNQVDNAGEAAGQFLAVNDPLAADNDDLEGIGTGTPPEAWAMFANEGGTGGDDLQIAGAFRSLGAPLAVGETFEVDFEHGMIQSGSLDANNPPRTGGWVGFALRAFPPPLQFDPDPFSPFASLQNALFAVGFRGGSINYQVYDVTQPSGFDSGLPFHTGGIRASFTITSTSTYDLVLAQLKPDGESVRFTNRMLTQQDHLYLGLYNRNAELADAFFNRIRIASDDADNDGDGMNDIWERLNGLNTTTNDAAIDDDGDGVSNLDEYLADTSPTNQFDTLTVTYPVNGEGDTVAFPTSPRRAYTLQYLDDLVNGTTWTDHPTFVDQLGLGGVMTVVEPSSATTTRSYRVRVRIPE